MLSVVSRLQSYQSRLVTEDYFSKIDLTNPDLLQQIQSEIDANPEKINEIISGVTDKFRPGEAQIETTQLGQLANISSSSQITSSNSTVNNSTITKTEDVNQISKKTGLFNGLFSYFSSHSTGYEASSASKSTIIIKESANPASESLYHDSRLPEKPVQSYKTINPYRNPPSGLSFVDPPMPDQFDTFDQNDLNAMQYKMEQTRLLKLANPNFIFHNKLPKCGTTTMHNIITILADWNNYTHLKVESARVQFSNERALIDIVRQALEQNKGKPLLMMKHHFWFDFKPFGLPQPTYINVLRNPITWFESRYYFTQNGWTRNPGLRKHDPMGDVGDMTVDECVIAKKEICMDVSWKYTRFFCGNNVVCKGKSVDEKRRALMLSKKRLIEDFYVVGILEQFNDTLRVFEKMMPNWFDLDFEALGTDFTQEAIKRTKTQNKIPMSENARAFFANGPLKYDMDLYNFGRALFNRQMAALGMKSSYLPKN